MHCEVREEEEGCTISIYRTPFIVISMMSNVAGPHVYDNWNALLLLSEPTLSKRLYSTLLEEKKLLVQAVAELIVNSDILQQKIKKRDLKTFEKGTTKRKRELLLGRNYRQKVVPKICKTAVKYLKNGSS